MKEEQFKQKMNVLEQEMRSFLENKGKNSNEELNKMK